jgi:2-octaprenylphenol hydroxylase
MVLSDHEFLTELAKSIEFNLGELEAVSTRYSIPLRQRHAKTYVKPGIVLLGDAAHTIHPLAGQGVNLGFKDVKALSEILLEADKQSLEVNNLILLKRYQRQRQGDNLLMMSAMEGFKRLFEQPDPIVRWIRNTGMNWVNKQSFLKNQIAKHAMGLSL